MRSFLGDLKGVLCYLFTTQGHIYIGTIEEVLEDGVRISTPDGRNGVYVLITDISGARPFETAEDG